MRTVIGASTPGQRLTVPSPGSGGPAGGDALAAHARLLTAELSRRWSSAPDSLESMFRYALGVPGKLFRPILLLESALAVGGQVGDVLPAAVGTECGHVASLIHDDIIDGDDVRRGQQAVHRKYGTDNAIVAGDALIFQLFLCLAECRQAGVPGDRIVSAMEIVARSGIELCRGQTLEAQITQDAVHDVETYLDMIGMKTAALFRGACQSGAVLGGGPADWVRALGDYGNSLGTAFQIQDDLLTYVGDRTAMGKPAASDIRNGRLTLPVILAYRAGGGPDRRVLDAALGGDGCAEEALYGVRMVLERTGALDASAELAVRYAGAARRALEELPPSPSRHRLAGFAELAVSRSW
jgi:geranylgeranyl pyrophosphate synthase